jgi:2-C-methyl-D-erythritol 4-phosphate cytidylyltransferase
MTEKKGPFADQKTIAIIPAAGAGSRLGSPRPKQFLDIHGTPLLALTLKPFQHSSAVDGIILTAPPQDVDYCQQEIIKRFSFDKVRKVVPGGERRQDSVRLGLEAAGVDYSLVVIHDGVRPLISAASIDQVILAARTHRAVITGQPAKETVKEVNNRGEVVKTYDRKRVWLVQTPQVFRYQDILRAHQEALRKGWEEATDDSILIERLGIPVTVVEGTEKNIKVTTSYDLELVRFLLKIRD